MATRSRLELQAILKKITPNVYFQPPETIKIKYPCIIYEKATEASRYADNNPYFTVNGYDVIVIDRDPDSLIPDSVRSLPMCAFNRAYSSDNLHHFVYRLYF